MKRIMLLVVALFAGSSSLSAQKSDVAIWVTTSQINEPIIGDEEMSATIETSEQAGYGLSLNHFWTDMISTEVAYQTFGGDVAVDLDGGISLDLGEIEASTLTGIAQLHFRRATRFSPYVGAGIAYVQGDFTSIEEGENFAFASESTWVANVGANIALTDRLAIALDAKHVQWEPKGEDDDIGERVDLSPLLLSAGLRVRF